MAVIKSLPATKSLSNQLNYLVKEGKTVEELKEGINCTTDNVEQEFNIIKQLHNKTEGKQYYHFTQAFSPEDNISPEKAHQLGKEWIENNIKGHQIYIVTHIDKNHIHNHFVINSVNMDMGLKLQISPSKLLEMKKDSNRLCERENLSKINLEANRGMSKTDHEYRLEKKGVTPWKDELRQCIDFGRNQTHSIGELKEFLKEHFNIEVRETKNSISYKHPEQNKSVRGNRLGGSYTKEGLLNEYNAREIKSNERGSRTEGNQPNRGYYGQTSTNRENIESSIFYGRNEIPSVRNDESISSIEKDNREFGKENGAVGEREEGTRTTQRQEHTELRQDNSRVATGNGGSKEVKLSEDRAINSSNAKITRNNSRDIHEVSGNIVRSKEHEGTTELERQSNSILTTTRGNSRNDIDDGRSLSPGNNLLDKIAKKFKVPKKEEKQKTLDDIITREQVILKTKTNVKTKNKSKGFGRDI